MLRRLFTWLFALGLVLSFDVPSVQAGGARIKSRIKLKEVVSRARVAVAATVKNIDHVWTGNGRRKHIKTFRFLVSVEKVLRGAHLLKGAGVTDTMWLHYENPRRANKWVVLRDYFKSPYELKKGRIGDSVIVFLTNPAPQGNKAKKPVLNLRWVVPQDLEKKVSALLKKELKALRASARAKAGCSMHGYFKFDGRCRSLKEIIQTVKCPRKTRKKGQWIREVDYELACRKKDKTTHGPAYYWDKHGYLRRMVTWKNGKPGGAHITYDAKGRKLKLTTRIGDASDGRVATFHPTGKVRLEGSMKKGLRHGKWTQRNAKGKALGTFKMKNGTGVFKSWRETGELYETRAYVKGVPHGANMRWWKNGKIQMSGNMKAGKMVGVWKSFGQDGGLQSAACHVMSKSGVTKVSWKTNDPKALKTKVCPTHPAAKPQAPAPGKAQKKR